MSDLISREATIAAIEGLNHGASMVRAKQSVTDRAVAAVRALPAAPAVKVKSLVWQGCDPDYTQADSSFGQYKVINTYHDGGFMMQVDGGRTAAYARTRGEAQDAAQADYEARILSALEGGEA